MSTRFRIRVLRPPRPRGWRAIADLRLEHARETDRLIPSFLLDSAVSRLGFRAVTLLAFAWGALWSTGRIERHDDLIVFRGMPRWTHARGGTCIGRCFLTHLDTLGEELLRHELVHVRQWRRYGLLMPILSAASGFDPLRNRFEIEAGLEDGGYVRR